MDLTDYVNGRVGLLTPLAMPAEGILGNKMRVLRGCTLCHPGLWPRWWHFGKRSSHSRLFERIRPIMAKTRRYSAVACLGLGRLRLQCIKPQVVTFVGNLVPNGRPDCENIVSPTCACSHYVWEEEESD